MEKNKGFTLVEVVAVITILGILALVVTPRIFSSLNKSKEQSYLEQARTLEKTAERWSIKNAGLLGTNDYYLEIKTLVNEKYLTSEDIVDPRSGQKMNGCIVISYDEEYNQYTFKYHENTCTELENR